MKDYETLSKNHFDKQAKRYDRKNTRNYSYFPKISCKDVANRLNQDISYKKLLDIGCGTGYLFGLLHGSLEKDLTGLDISPKMLEVANQKFGGRFNFILGNARDLPFEDESFDVVTCIQSFHHYPFPEKAMKEAFRVLKPGGYFILSDTGIGGLPKSFYNHVYLPLLKSGDYAVYSERDIEQLMRRAGFKSINSFRIKPVVYTVIGKKSYNLDWLGKSPEEESLYGKIDFFH